MWYEGQLIPSFLFNISSSDNRFLRSTLSEDRLERLSGQLNYAAASAVEAVTGTTFDAW
jgi:hypothetical protein